ncbi:MAG: prepilin peptidase [Steroidobacteraceae bacterium]
MPVTALLRFAVLLGAGSWAVRADLLTHRIPNRLTGSVLCLGLAVGLGFYGWRGFGDALLGALIGLGMLLPFYLLRGMGAGDVKLLAALGSLLGPHWALIAGVCTLLFGAVLAIGYVLIESVRAAALPAGVPLMLRLYSAGARAYQMRRERFPYAIAISMGGLAAAMQRGDVQSTIAYLSGAPT